MSTVMDFSATLSNGNEVALGDYAGKVLLIVNTASKCGFTPQYTGLESLQKTYSANGFSVLAFPCNQFGGQEPGDRDAILKFACDKYGATFPLFEKVDVNGFNAHPVWRYLKKQQSNGFLLGDDIQWNFAKFESDSVDRAKI